MAATTPFRACWRSGFVTLLVLASLFICQAQVAEAASPSAESAALWNLRLNEAEGFVQGGGLNADSVAEYRALIEKVRTEAIAAKAAVEGELAATGKLLEALGPVPAEGAAPEAAEIVAERQRFNRTIADHKARLAQADVTLARVGALEKSFSSLSRARLVDQILAQTPFPLSPEVVAQAVPDFYRTVEILVRSPFEWYEHHPGGRASQLVMWRAVLVVILAVLVAWILRRFLLRHLGRDPAVLEPTYARRFLGAIADGLARGIVPASVFSAFYFWFARPDSLLTGIFGQVVVSLLLALILFTLTHALQRAILAPDLPTWRLTQLAPENARAISRRITFLAAILAVDLFFQFASRDLFISRELESLFLLVFTTPEVLGVLALTQGRLWRAGMVSPAVDGDGISAAVEADSGGFWPMFRRAVAVVSIGSVLALLVGYGGIGRFLIERLLLSAVVLGPLFLLRELLQEFLDVLIQSSVVRKKMGVAISTLRKIKFWMRAALDPSLFLVGAFLVIPFWGVPREDLVSWTVAIIQGFTLGNVTISLGDIALAFIVFFGAMAATRLLQRTLLERVLPETRLTVSAQHSMTAVVGYVGVLVAVALSIAVVGIDLTNFALIAGALSVGIGFGLQTVVNNFVSGVILLIERPVKVGDWVIVGALEGTVKRVNFRATELETWQRASVIIPNAEIISNPVINWTHKDRHGRIEILVGVAYGSETERVREVLVEVARAHPKTLSVPEPYVLFQNFGDSSLDFELRCFTADILQRMSIASDMRFEIDRRFHEAGIEIPFPQRVVHIPAKESDA
jgi:potassium-dependent mechanosensitive channel